MVPVEQAETAGEHSPIRQASAIATVPSVSRRWAHITGYDAACDLCCPGTNDGVTSTGVDVSRHPWGVAAAKKMLPRGALVRIAGYHGGRWVRVDDDGGRMRRDARRGILHVDVRCRTHAEALKINYWGWVEVRDE